MKYISLIVIILSVLLLSSCGGVSRVVSLSTMLARETDRIMKMEQSEIEKLVDPTIDMNRVKNDSEGILGLYVKLQGTVDLKGTKDFPLDKGLKVKSSEEGGIFILDDTVFVFALPSIKDLNQGDYVEIVGLVSMSRFIKATSELYPDEKIPPLVTVIAKSITKVEKEPEEIVSEETGVTQESDKPSQSEEPIT